MTQPSNSGAVYPIAVAAAARGVQLAIRAQALRDAMRVWPLLERARLGETFGTWLQVMAAIVNTYRGQSATAAGRFYGAARAHALDSPTPDALIHLAPQAEWSLLRNALGFSGPGMMTRDVAKPNTALSTTLGTTARLVLDAGRQTVADTARADKAAVGWYRVTDGHPCSFCALLASRGVVYKKDTSAFKSHNDCGCSGAPAFSRDQPLPELSDRAAQVYRERGSGDALKAFRAAWDAHQAQSA